MESTPASPAAPTPTTPPPGPPSEVVPRRPPARRSRIERRLQAKVGDEPVVAWTRAWVSRDGHAHTLVAARTLDFCVLTDRALYMFNTGFLSRQPRRKVYASRIDRLTATFRKQGRVPRLLLASAAHRSLRLDVRSNQRGRRFAQLLTDRTTATGATS